MKIEVNAIDVIERLKKALNFNKDYELADKIGMKHNTFNSRKMANSIPYDEFIQLAASENLNLNWLLTGDGDMYRNTKVNQLAPEEKAVLTLYQELDSKQKSDVLSFAEEKKQYNVMRRQIERLISRDEQQQMSA